MRYAWLLWCAAALGAEQAVPPGEWFTNPILQAQERQSAMYAYVSRNIPPLPRFQTLEAWQSYKPKLRSRLLRLLGIDDILAQNQLRVVRQGRIDRDTYTIEKIRYESYPGMWVSALVWSPKRVTGKAPAAVSISGHTYCESKAADYVQQRNYNLVRRGFIVVSYDYFGCGDRGIPAACQPGGWGGFDHLNSLFSYTRRTPTGIEALDGIRAVDYLYSRPDVDRTRILFTGESGGGNNTYWASALDERVTLSVPVSSGGAFSQWIKADLNYDWHQRPPGLRAVADIGSLYALIAPRPLL
ncbi:MAG TPA: acetylxylan esterase, partial [Bryobacteraceae bacterium]|nr:acetylxylan esterase [Bryobacteraceae bacterium]